MNVFTLGHQHMFRAGSSANGCTTVERTSADFLINGESLLNLLVKADGGHSDFMGCFVKGFPEENRRASAKLMVRADFDTEQGGALLYICPECGDIGCGAYSVRISKTNSGYTWEEFAYENGYEEPRTVAGVGPFQFAQDEYEAALRRAAAF